MVNCGHRKQNKLNNEFTSTCVKYTAMGTCVDRILELLSNAESQPMRRCVADSFRESPVYEYLISSVVPISCATVIGKTKSKSIRHLLFVISTLF